MDVAVVNASENTDPGTVSVLLGNGDGTLQRSRTTAAGLTQGLLTVGDFNGDGNLDLAVAAIQLQRRPGGFDPGRRRRWILSTAAQLQYWRDSSRGPGRRGLQRRWQTGSGGVRPGQSFRLYNGGKRARGLSAGDGIRFAVRLRLARRGRL